MLKVFQSTKLNLIQLIFGASVKVLIKMLLKINRSILCYRIKTLIYIKIKYVLKVDLKFSFFTYYITIYLFALQKLGHLVFYKRSCSSNMIAIKMTTLNVHFCSLKGQKSNFIYKLLFFFCLTELSLLTF